MAQRDINGNGDVRNQFKTTLQAVGDYAEDVKPLDMDKSCIIDVDISGISTSEIRLFKKSIKGGANWTQVLDESGLNPLTADGNFKIETFTGAEYKFDLYGGTDTNIDLEFSFLYA